ncbi:MAG: hypothetical protein HOQ32_07840 [Lysobacter sp.]|nr:hypothetical protein [Lysobacter sp.]
MKASNQSPSTQNHAYPFDLHWTSDDLAGAMPLRLSELFDFDAARAQAQPSANVEAPAHAWRRNGYSRNATQTAFRVR